MKKDSEAAEITLAADGTITINRNARTMETARTLTDYIHTLPLTAEQNNELVRLILEHVTEAEKGAFVGGTVWIMRATVADEAEEQEQEAARKPKHIKLLQ